MTEGNEPTLTVLHEGVPIFTSYGKWLHPLFELEDYLAAHPIQPENLILQDKIVGKAAALMIQRLGIRTVKAGILSRPGEAVLQRHGIAYSYEELVDRIHCQTEELLVAVEDSEEAYRLVKERAAVDQALNAPEHGKARDGMPFWLSTLPNITFDDRFTISRVALPDIALNDRFAVFGSTLPDITFHYRLAVFGSTLPDVTLNNGFTVF